jgi:hypothetical protein
VTGALVEIAEVSLTAPLPSGLEAGFVDQPRPGAVLEANAVDLVGWVLGAAGEAVAVELGCDGQTVGRAKLRGARPDLVAAFPGHPQAASAGFRTTVDLGGSAAEFELEVAAVLEDRQRVPLATIRGSRRWRRDRAPAYAALVSVIVVGRPPADHLGEAIQSVLAQSYPEVELVVVEDGSSDEAAAIAAGYGSVRRVCEPSAGVAASRNAGIRNSNGDFLVFLDSGERLLPEALATGVGALAGRPECAAAIGDCRGAGCSARAIYRRSLFEQVRGFDPSLGAAAGLALERRVAREFAIAAHPGAVAERRQDGGYRRDQLRAEARLALRERHFGEALRSGLTLARERP